MLSTASIKRLAMWRNNYAPGWEPQQIPPTSHFLSSTEESLAELSSHWCGFDLKRDCKELMRGDIYADHIVA